jgi:adenylate cyclase class IV
VAVVHKRRQVFQVRRTGHRLQVSLDVVEGLGPFAELEIMAEPAQLEEARNVLLSAAAELGLQHAERRSYLELLLLARGQHEPPLADTNARRA